jgi:hypothetical protein
VKFKDFSEATEKKKRGGERAVGTEAILLGLEEGINLF